MLIGKGDKYADKLLGETYGKSLTELNDNVIFAYNTYGGENSDKLFQEQLQLISLLRQKEGFMYTLSEVTADMLY